MVELNSLIDAAAFVCDSDDPDGQSASARAQPCCAAGD